MSKQIEIIIGADGSVNIEAVNFKGSSCEQATKAFEEALGVIGTRKKKPEYHSSNTTAAQQKVGS